LGDGEIEKSLFGSFGSTLRNGEIEKSLFGDLGGLGLLVFGSFGSTLRNGEIEKSLPRSLRRPFIVFGLTLRNRKVEESLLFDVATEDAAEETGVTSAAELGSAVEQALVVVVSVPREDVAEQTLVAASGNLGTAVEQAFLHTVAAHAVSGTVDVADLGASVEESLDVGFVFVFSSSEDAAQETAVVLTVTVVGVALTIDLGAAIEKTLLVIDVPTEDVSEQTVDVVETDFDLVLLTFPLETAFSALSVTGRGHATVAGNNYADHRDVCQCPTVGEKMRGRLDDLPVLPPL
jgi:hypothetical protein